MSPITKHSEARVIWTIGNTQIVESEPDQGIIPTMKAAFLGIAAITAAPVSPVIAIALAGYAAMKIFESFNLSGREAREVMSNLYDDVNGEEPETVPPGWVPMPHLPGEMRYQPSPQTKLDAIDVPVQPDQPFSLPVASPESKLFDWNLLNTAYDDFPHLLLLGKTGAGKSFLAEHLGRFLNGSTLVITPKKKPKDFAGLQVIGVPYDFATIAANITGLSTLVKQREDQMNRTGADNFLPINVILDEVPTFVSGCKDLGLDVVKDLKFVIRAGRTSKVRLILLAQGQEVRTLGIEGEGSLRDNLSYVYLKGFAEARARELKLDISKHDRPCIIDGKAADISKLVSLAPEPTPQQVVEQKPTATPQDLERMYNAPSAQVEHDADEQEISDYETEDVAEETNTLRDRVRSTLGWTHEPSIELASKVVEYLEKRSTERFKPHRIKSGLNHVRGIGSLPPEKFKNLLNSLVSKGLIEFDSEKDEYAIAQSKQEDWEF